MTSRIAKKDLEGVADKARKFLDENLPASLPDDPEFVGSYHAAVAGILTARMHLDRWEIDVGALRFFGMDVPGDVADDTRILAIGCDETGPRVQLLFMLVDH